MIEKKSHALEGNPDVNMPSVLKYYFAFCYFFAILIFSAFISTMEIDDMRTFVFALTVTITYPLLYLSPSIFITWALYRLIPRIETTSWKKWCLFTSAITGASLVNILLYADSRLYDLYHFHFNGFVMNILTTPGGLESLGAGTDTYVMALVSGAIIFLIHIVFLVISRALARSPSFNLNKQILRVYLMVLLACAILDRGIYGVSDIDLHAHVLNGSSAVPFYNGVTFRQTAEALGVEPYKSEGMVIKPGKTRLQYPLGEVKYQKSETPMNIIWLTAESWRWDMLAADIMPSTLSFANRSQHFLHHISGGNGTRQGLFALFYGIPGTYWDSFLVEGKGPVLFDVLAEQGYQMSMYTGATFTYPEFDKTIFAQISPEQLHEPDSDLSPWQRDSEDVSSLLEFIDHRDPTKPFMSFVFFESTHARYDFPQSSALRKLYLDNVNFSTMSRDSLKNEILELKNRYVNASHYLDSQFERIFQYLEQHDLLKNTIVLVTGDHGEAFMENGFWGHNIGFTREEINTPMLIYIPGLAAKKFHSLTSHMDVIPTLAPYIGINSEVRKFASGINMLGKKKNTHVIVSDWNGVCYVGSEYKFLIPFKKTFSGLNTLTTSEDKPDQALGEFISSHSSQIQSVLAETSRFNK